MGGRRYIYCPNCGARNEIENNFCAMCGTSLREVARRVLAAQPSTPQPAAQPPPKPAPKLPPHVQQTLSPGILVHLFYDKYFKTESSFRADVAVAATLYALEAEGCVALIPSKRGRIRKHDTVEIRKLRDFDPGRFGYLSKQIHKLKRGKSINVYDLVKRAGKMAEHPISRLMELVVENDLTRETWNFLYEERVRRVKRSLLDKLLLIPGEFRSTVEREENIRLYEPQAERLSQLVARRMREKPAIHEIIQRECAEALEDLTYVPSEDWY